MNPNNNYNNYNNFPGYRPRPITPTQPDMNDPNLLNNPAFYQMFNQMNVNQQMGFQPGFYNWSTPQEPYGFGGSSVQGNTPGSHFDRQRLVDTPPRSPEVEVVQETQLDVGGSRPRKPKRKHTKKPVEERTTRATAVAWTPEEEMHLARAWIDVSEDPLEANYQKERTYWARICSKLLKLSGKPEGYRDGDGVGSKFRKMRPIIANFNQIYTRMTNANNHQSGENDADVIKRALAEYEGVYGKSFPYFSIWNKIRHCSKFHYVTDFDAKKVRQPSAKRSKTSSSTEPHSQGSDARCNFDLNSFNLDDDEPIFQERVGGRDAARKAAHGGSSSSSGKGKGKEKMDKLDDISMKLDGLMSITQERVGMGKEKMELEKKKLQAKENVIKLAELRVLTTDVSELDEPARSIMLKAQQEIKEKYGYM